MKGGELVPIWAKLVSLLVHPVKVAIVEALLWVGEPMSPTVLKKALGDPELDISLISYHVTSLAKHGLLVKVREEPVRGVIENFYLLCPES